MGSVLIKEKKQTIVQEIIKNIQAAKSTTIVHYHGLTVENLTSLRVDLRTEGIQLKIYKNRLVKIALSQLQIANLDLSLLGPNALVFSNTDEISGPKLLAKFAKKHKELILKSAILDGHAVLHDELQILATLPSKDGLISMFASAIISPLLSFALVVKEIAKQKTEPQ